MSSKGHKTSITPSEMNSSENAKPDCFIFTATVPITLPTGENKGLTKPASSSLGKVCSKGVESRSEPAKQNWADPARSARLSTALIG